LEQVGGYAFWRCSALAGIVIPRSVEVIGTNCFDGCKSLRSITFESSSKLKRIEASAFEDCESLKGILIPKSVEFVDGSALIGLTKDSVSLEVGNAALCLSNDILHFASGKGWIRYLGSDSSVSIPRDVDAIGPSCFQYCHQLSQVSFESPSQLKRIDNSAFNCCSSLRQIVIPWTVEDVGSHGLSGCSSLSSITFEPNSRLQRIGGCGFCSCSSLPTICIPRRVEVLGHSCFQGCESLSWISFESDSVLCRIESTSFQETALRSAVLPSGLMFCAWNAFPLSCDLTMTKSCPEFLAWNTRRKFGEEVPFEFDPSNQVQPCPGTSPSANSSEPRNKEKEADEPATTEPAAVNKPSVPEIQELISDWVVDLSRFEAVGVIRRRAALPIEILENKRTGCRVAVKCFPPLDVSGEETFFREIEALVSLDHPCIVPFFELDRQAPRLQLTSCPVARWTRSWSPIPPGGTGRQSQLLCAELSMG
jgi:hypothetical protein